MAKNPLQDLNPNEPLPEQEGSESGRAPMERAGFDVPGDGTEPVGSADADADAARSGGSVGAEAASAGQVGAADVDPTPVGEDDLAEDMRRTGADDAQR